MAVWGGGLVGFFFAVLSLETLAQDLRKEIINLRRVNQFILFLSPVLPYPGPETGLVKDTGLVV